MRSAWRTHSEDKLSIQELGPSVQFSCISILGVSSSLSKIAMGVLQAATAWALLACPLALAQSAPAPLSTAAATPTVRNSSTLPLANYTLVIQPWEVRLTRQCCINCSSPICKLACQPPHAAACSGEAQIWRHLHQTGCPKASLPCAAEPLSVPSHQRASGHSADLSVDKW